MTQLNMMNQDMYNTDSAFVKYNVFSNLIHIKKQLAMRYN